ncbi:MAG: winged helix-turn-helix transcriptional regulator [Candidatus Woesearchaeota archaeon]
MKMDLYDKKILYELDKNARISASKIGKKIQLPKETVNYRIKRLIKSDYIKYFYTIINGSMLGYQYYKMFLKYYKITSDIEESIIDFLKKEKSCSNIKLTEGPYDISFVTMQRHPYDVKRFLEALTRNYGEYLQKKSVHTLITSYKFNQKIFYQEETIKTPFYLGEPYIADIDDLDLKILKQISMDARVKLIDLSRCLKEKPQVIKYHLNKLEDMGVIVGYYTSLNLDKFNRELIQLDVVVKDHSVSNRMIEFFDSTKTCFSAYEVLGSYDLCFELYVKDDNHLRELTDKFKHMFLDNYVNFDVSHVYEEYQIGWSPFENDEPCEVDGEEVAKDSSELKSETESEKKSYDGSEDYSDYSNRESDNGSGNDSDEDSDGFDIDDEE